MAQASLAVIRSRIDSGLQPGASPVYTVTLRSAHFFFLRFLLGSQIQLILYKTAVSVGTRKVGIQAQGKIFSSICPY